MKISIIQDKYNNTKLWIIKKDKHYNYYYTQVIRSINPITKEYNIINKKLEKTSKKFLKDLFSTNQNGLKILENI